MQYLQVKRIVGVAEFIRGLEATLTVHVEGCDSSEDASLGFLLVKGTRPTDVEVY